MKNVNEDAQKDAHLEKLYEKSLKDEMREYYNSEAIRLNYRVNGKIDTYDDWLERDKKGWESIGLKPILKKWGFFK